MNATERNAAAAALEAIVGARHALTDASLFAGALVEPRGLYRGKALAFVRPGSTEEVARVAAFCNNARIGIVPQGGNTGLVGGQTPDGSGDQIILSTQRLNAIREVDPHAEAMICEAGVRLVEAQAAALAADRLFPLSLAAEGSCTVGGNVSTNAGGVTVTAYGNMRDLVTGVEAVLADGRIVHALTKLRKDNTGYDVKDLFIGAEGTLGIVTAASLRLFPNPRVRATAFVGLESPERALELLALARERLGAGVVSFELIGRMAYDITVGAGLARAPLTGAHKWYVLMEGASQIPGGFEEAFAGTLETALERGAVEDAAIAASLEQRHEFWKLREIHPGGADPRGRLDQARRLGRSWRRARPDCRGDTRGRGVRARLPRGRLWPSRRWQHPFQRLPAGRRGQNEVPRPMGRDERDRARHRRAPRRLLRRRAWGWKTEARASRANQGPGIACAYANDQGGDRPERDYKSRQGSMTASPLSGSPASGQGGWR